MTINKKSSINIINESQAMADCDLEWERFLNGEDIGEVSHKNIINEQSVPQFTDDTEKLKQSYNDSINSCELKSYKEGFSQNKNLEDIISDINISTTTKITYLNKEIDLKNDFWKIDVMDYYTPEEGVIKKQMKYIINDNEEQEYFDKMVKKQVLYTELMDLRKKNILGTNKKIGRNVYKISIGVRTKDFVNKNTKKSQAFFNCFVLIIRMKDDNGMFIEVHMKIFNTGKIEIPGMKNDDMFYKVLSIFKTIYKRNTGVDLEFKDKDIETILINSNFNCGFYINREKLYNILKTKYNLNCSYDPCTYPGIQNVFYFEKNSKDIDFNGIITDTQRDLNKGKRKNKNLNYVSFMVFRTGSILIVGKCNETTLYKIYNYIKNMLIEEYDNINCGLNNYKCKSKDEAIVKQYRPIKY
jgi:TATA-box binding protein (TBP) (component of TFIID and TFIIIB)